MSRLVDRGDTGSSVLTPWDPFAAFARSTAWPPLDVIERGDALVIIADVPGLTEDELSVTLTGRTLAIAGPRDEGAAAERRIELPSHLDLDHVEADLRDGVLTIRVPKPGAAAPRRLGLGNVVDRVKGLLSRKH